jgi:hypothetical protein
LDCKPSTKISCSYESYCDERKNNSARVVIAFIDIKIDVDLDDFHNGTETCRQWLDNAQAFSFLLPFTPPH